MAMQPYADEEVGIRPEGSCTHDDGWCSPGAVTVTEDAPRAEALRRALQLAYITISWNTLEGLIAVLAANRAQSVALLAFGVDSFVECASGLAAAWRIRSEQNAESADRAGDIERKAQKLIAASLFLLAAYVFFDAAKSLWLRQRPEFSSVGIAVTAVSLVVMLWLARAKRRAARALESRALEADAFQTTACWWLSLATLVGIGLNGLLGWWWADPAAGLVITGLLLKEGRETWKGTQECC